MGIRRLAGKHLLFLFILMLISSCANSPPSSKISKIPITKNGKMSTVVLSLVKRQNYINDGNQTFSYPDGLVFYFIIYPFQAGNYPAVKQYQNFSINGEPYWKNIPAACDSYTLIYNLKTFEEQEPEVFKKTSIRKNSNPLIQKTVICGDPIPPDGIVSYLLFFGFGQNLEGFEFTFALKDIL